MRHPGAVRAGGTVVDAKALRCQTGVADSMVARALGHGLPRGESGAGGLALCMVTTPRRQRQSGGTPGK